MNIRILSCAERELAEVVDHYNQEQPGLGFVFAAEVEKALDRIRAFPNAWPQFSKRSRRYVVQRFPYGVLYQVRADGVLVLAIMHLRRDPKVWQERVGEGD